MNMEKTIAFDFDGVIHQFKKGWQGAEIISEKPVRGIRNVLSELKVKGYKITIYSCRALTLEGYRAMVKWLAENKMIEFIEDITSSKPIAKVMVDDRCINFRGNTTSLVDEIESFRSWEEL